MYLFIRSTWILLCSSTASSKASHICLIFAWSISRYRREILPDDPASNVSSWSMKCGCIRLCRVRLEISMSSLQSKCLYSGRWITVPVCLACVGVWHVSVYVTVSMACLEAVCSLERSREYHSSELLYFEWSNFLFLLLVLLLVGRVTFSTLRERERESVCVCVCVKHEKKWVFIEIFWEEEHCYVRFRYSSILSTFSV